MFAHIRIASTALVGGAHALLIPYPMQPQLQPVEIRFVATQSSLWFVMFECQFLPVCRSKYSLELSELAISTAGRVDDFDWCSAATSAYATLRAMLYMIAYAISVDIIIWALLAKVNNPIHGNASWLHRSKLCDSIEIASKLRCWNI